VDIRGLTPNVASACQIILFSMAVVSVREQGISLLD
jgi:hypothetical protein